jgi:broad specificity phosphatase PhoE
VVGPDLGLAAPDLAVAPGPHHPFPDGESLAAVQARAVAACEAVAAAHPAATVAAVSHGDVIALVLAHYLGMPLDLYHRLSVPPASLSTIDLPGDGPAVIRSVAAGPEAV